MADKIIDGEYRIVEAPETVESYDSNKLKLQMVSRLAIMGVQQAFLTEFVNKVKSEKISTQQELAKEEDITDADEYMKLTQKVVALIDTVNILTNSQNQFSDIYSRVINTSGKLLKLPEENLIELINVGKISYEGEKLTLLNYDDLAENFEDGIDSVRSFVADKDVLVNSGLVFDNIDQTALEESINAAMTLNEDKVSAVNDANLSSIATEIATDAKNIYNTAVTAEDMGAIFDNMINQSNTSSDQPEVAPEEEKEGPVVGSVTTDGSGVELEDIDFVKLLEEARAQNEELTRNKEEATASVEASEEAKRKALEEKESAMNQMEQEKEAASRYRSQVESFREYFKELELLNKANAEMAAEISAANELASKNAEEASQINSAIVGIKTEIDGYRAEKEQALKDLRAMQATLTGSGEEVKTGGHTK